MTINLSDLPPSVQKHTKKTLGVRVRVSQDTIRKHALAVAAMLLDDRGLSSKDARRILQKAISLLT